MLKLRCNECGKILKDHKQSFCNIDCSKANKLSSEGERQFPIKITDPDYNKTNYSNSKNRLKQQHKSIGHLVNVS